MEPEPEDAGFVIGMVALAIIVGALIAAVAGA